MKAAAKKTRLFTECETETLGRKAKKKKPNSSGVPS